MIIKNWNKDILRSGFHVILLILLAIFWILLTAKPALAIS
jgi:hypothetical protein